MSRYPDLIYQGGPRVPAAVLPFAAESAAPPRRQSRSCGRHRSAVHAGSATAHSAAPTGTPQSPPERLCDHQLAEGSVQPASRVGRSQWSPRPVADIVEEPFQGHEPRAKPEPNATTKTGPVRSAQDPGIVSPSRVGPQRAFARIQRDVLSQDRQFGPFLRSDRMTMARVSRSSTSSIRYSGSRRCDPACVRRRTPQRLHSVAARERAPRADPMGLQEVVSTRTGPAVPAPWWLELERPFKTVRREQFREPFDGYAEQPGHAPPRDKALVDGQSHHLRMARKSEPGARRPPRGDRCFEVPPPATHAAAAVLKAPSATSRHLSADDVTCNASRRRVQSPDQLSFGDVRPIAAAQQASGRHERRRCEVVGELFLAVPAVFPRSFGVRRRHGVPRQDVEELMGEIEMTATGDLTPRDQDRVHLWKATGRPGDVAIRIDHEEPGCRVFAPWLPSGAPLARRPTQVRPRTAHRHASRPQTVSDG